MANTFHEVISLPDRSYQAIARAELKAITAKVGFTPHRLAEIEIIIAEITSNLVKHTTSGGQILCRVLDEPGQEGIELISIDDGPGIAALSHSMKDGISSKKTLGQGLGAIQRLSDLFDIYSIQGWGTIVLSRVYLKKPKVIKPVEKLMMETLRVAKTGEKKCGDNWTLFLKGKLAMLTMIDGLGHGEDADAAATAAVEHFRKQTVGGPCDQLRDISTVIKKTRGAVMTIAQIDVANKQMTYCSVGNILTRLVNQPLSMAARTFSSYNGIVGHTLPRVMNNTTIPWDGKLDMLIMHSDGLSGRWDLGKYPRILQKHGMVLCAALYKDHNRGTDDTTVAAIRSVKEI
ncbi:MAG: serine/threonine protein kinase [Citrobacter freundii]|nr:MAG: serine/threonine protein kinase [Citrobacter freundii]